MPWQNDGGSGGGTGGPWGSNNGGSTGGAGSSGGPKNPWGPAPPPRAPGGTDGAGRSAPDFDEFIRRSQEKLRSSFGGGGGASGGSGGGSGRSPWSYIIGGVVIVWLAFTSFYRVGPQERGVLMRFGKYVSTAGPGVHLKLPSPIDTVIKPKVESVRSDDIGGSNGQENLMLTGDQNIIDVAYTVRWKINDPEDYLFELAEPESTVREVAESAMRAEMAEVNLQAAIGPQRAAIADAVRNRAQELLTSYRAGIEIVGVDIRQADPPNAVDDAFKQVSAAQQNAQGALNNARAYSQELIASAQGQTAVFDAVYAQYKLAPQVTRKRIYLETMEEVLAKNGKTIIEAKGVTPYLPLGEIQRRVRTTDTTPAPGQ